MVPSSRWLSVQTMVSSGYRDETVTEEDESRAFGSTRSLEPLHVEKRF